jgi:hypothetical protein
MMYWQMTHIWWHFVERLYYMIFGWWISWADLRKANFILKILFKTFFQDFIFQGSRQPPYITYWPVCSFWAKLNIVLKYRNHHPSECMAPSLLLIVASQVFKAFRNGDEILPYIPCLETQLSITGDSANRLVFDTLQGLCIFTLRLILCPYIK